MLPSNSRSIFNRFSRRSQRNGDQGRRVPTQQSVTTAVAPPTPARSVSPGSPTDQRNTITAPQQIINPQQPIPQLTPQATTTPPPSQGDDQSGITATTTNTSGASQAPATGTTQPTAAAAATATPAPALVQTATTPAVPPDPATSNTDPLDDPVFYVSDDEPTDQEFRTFDRDIKGLLQSEINRISGRWGGRNIGGFQTLYKGGVVVGQDTTTIVIVCNDDSLRARLESDRQLNRFLDSCSFPFVMLHDNSLRDTGGNPLRSPFLGCNIFLRQPESSALNNTHVLYGQALEVPGTHGLVSRCTLGGLVSADGKLYGLTVGHIFDDWDHGEDDARKAARRRSVSSGRSRPRASTSESLKARRIAQSMRGLKRTSPSHLKAVQDNDTSPYLVIDDKQAGPESKIDFPYWTILGKLQNVSSTENNDWALIDLDPSLTTPIPNVTPHSYFKRSFKQTVSVSALRASKPSGKAPVVTISTGFSGSHEGKLRIMSSVSWWFGKKQFDAYSIRLDRPLAPGDSGSLVMHDGAVCGIIVGAIDSLKTAFMLDIGTVLNDIETQLNCSTPISIAFVQIKVKSQSTTNIRSDNSAKSSPMPVDSARVSSMPLALEKPKYMKPNLLKDNSAPDLRYPKGLFFNHWRPEDSNRPTTIEARHVVTPFTTFPEGTNIVSSDQDALKDIAESDLNSDMVIAPSRPSGAYAEPHVGTEQEIPDTKGEGNQVPSSRSEIDEEERQVINDAIRVLSLHEHVKRPQRRRTIRFSSPHFSFEDIVRYIIRQQRIMKIIQIFLGLSSSHLCKDCEALDLRVDDFIITKNDKSSSTSRRPGAFVGGSSSGTRWLGSLRLITVKSLWCSFCRLISSSIREQDQMFWVDPRAIIYNGTQQYEAHNQGRLDAHCGIIWSIDGYAKNDDTGDTSTTSLLDTSETQVYTRRLEVLWDDERIQSSNIVLSASSAKAQLLSDEFLGTPGAGEDSIVSTIKDWMSVCDERHDGRCRHRKSKIPGRQALEQPFFMVVDLLEMRLTSLPHHSDYATLSYLWGGISGASTRRSNVRSLQARDGIQKIYGKLARTVQDAFDCARSLGLRYIWIDALCIIRDSETSQRLNSSIMHQIYANSHVTICAASSTDGQGGLYSNSDDVSENYRLYPEKQAASAFPRPIKEHYKPLEEQYSHNVRLMTAYSARYYVKKSPWFNRSWAFSESVLSPRSIIFVDGHVFWQCRTSVFRQDIVPGMDYNSRSFDSDALPIKLFDSTLSHPLETYGEMVERYSRKELSSKHDILSAFWGIGSYLDKFLGGDGFLYGLPRSHFDCAMLWQPNAASSDVSELESLRRGRHRVVESERINEDFPSWTWARYINTPVRYDTLRDELIVTDVKTWIRNHTWIIWFVRDRHGNLTPVWHPGLSSEPDRERKRRLKTSLGYGSPPPPQYNKDDISYRTDIYGRPLTRHLPTDDNPPEFSSTLPEFPARPNVDYEPAGVARPDSSGGGGSKHNAGGSTRFGNAGTSTVVPDLFDSELPLLQFWTYSAWFALQPTDPPCDLSDGANPPAYVIVDNCNELRGLVRFDSVELAKQAMEQSRREAMGPHYRYSYRYEGAHHGSKTTKTASSDRSRRERDVSANRGRGSSSDRGHGFGGGAERPVLQFIAVSEAYSFTAADEDTIGGKYEGYVGERAVPKPWSVFYVLLLMKQDDGVHRRVGLGRIDKEAFRYSCRNGGRCKWDEFILG